MVKTFFSVLHNLIKALYRLLFIGVFLGMLILNVGMIALPTVYNVISGIFWGAVELVSEGYAYRSATRAVSRQEIDQADLDRRNTRAALQASTVERNRLANENAVALRRITQLEPLQAEVEGLKLQNTRLSTSVSALESDNRRLVSEINSIQLELSRSRSAQNQAISVAEELTRENRALGNQVLELNSELDAGRDAQRVVRSEITSISNRMQQRSIRMVARNTSLVVTESMPLIGTVAIVGGLAWDIKDTCDQLVDLSQLERAVNSINDGSAVIGSNGWCGLDVNDIFNRLYSGGSTPEKLCIEARLRTRTMNPPECGSVNLDDDLFPESIYDELPVPTAIDLGID